MQPSLAGPKRPQDRFDLSAARATVGRHIDAMQQARDGQSVADRDVARPESEGAQPPQPGVATVVKDGKTFELSDGAVVIAAITSCTNTSNPQVMVGAGLLARNAAARGLQVKPWVKTSMAPGSKVVTGYLEKAGLMDAIFQANREIQQG